MTSVALPGPPRRARFLRRYKRFFVDVEIDGEVVVAHTPNTGSMRGLLHEGNDALLTWRDTPGRKLPWALEALDVGSAWVCTNTLLPNRLVGEALRSGAVPDLWGYGDVRAEAKVGEGTRIDFLLSAHEEGAPDALVEVKSVTLREGARALFPDAVSERGRKHLDTLRAHVEAGGRAAVFFCVQRNDCLAFAPAANIDPAYAEALVEAYEAGVMIIAYQTRIDEQGLHLDARLPFELAAPARGYA